MKSLLLTLLASILATTTVTAVDFGGGDFGKQKFCPPYRCRKGEEPVPKWPLKLTSPGCAGMGGMAMFGGKGGDDDGLTQCCDLRHACHQTCGSLKTACDEEFQKCIEDTCNARDGEAKEACESSSGIYKIMVQMDNSCQKYDSEQYTHCECVKEGKVAEAREKILQKFYKKFNPDSAHKVPNLAAKADNSRKMAALMGKLYKKWPEAIKRVKDPQQEEMERMMKQADAKREEGGGDDVQEEEEDDGSHEHLEF